MSIFTFMCLDIFKNCRYFHLLWCDLYNWYSAQKCSIPSGCLQEASVRIFQTVIAGFGPKKKQQQMCSPFFIWYLAAWVFFYRIWQIHIPFLNFLAMSKLLLSWGLPWHPAYQQIGGIAFSISHGSCAIIHEIFRDVLIFKSKMCSTSSQLDSSDSIHHWEWRGQKAVCQSLLLNYKKEVIFHPGEDLVPRQWNHSVSVKQFSQPELKSGLVVYFFQLSFKAMVI